MTSLAPLLQAFFTDRLMTQRQASGNTIAAYRDTFKLLLGYLHDQTGTAPSTLEISDLDAGAVTGFLTYLEDVRGNSVRTRNARLAAIHSLFNYAALRHPEHAAVIQRVLAIPTARFQRNIVAWLDPAEADAFLAACNQETRTGRRDHAMFTLAIQTGLRISELIGLTVTDIHTGIGPHVHCLGKGRKDRRTRWTRRCCVVHHHHRTTAQPRRDRTTHPRHGDYRDSLMPIPERQTDHRAHAASHRRDDAATPVS